MKINIKKLSYEQSFTILINWLQNCEKIRRLDFDINYYGKLAVNTSIKKGIPPNEIYNIGTKKSKFI